MIVNQTKYKSYKYHEVIAPSSIIAKKRYLSDKNIKICPGFFLLIEKGYKFMTGFINLFVTILTTINE